MLVVLMRAQTSIARRHRIEARNVTAKFDLWAFRARSLVYAAISVGDIRRNLSRD